jgi:hypothetical protein
MMSHIKNGLDKKNLLLNLIYNPYLDPNWH